LILEAIRIRLDFFFETAGLVRVDESCAWSVRPHLLPLLLALLDEIFAKEKCTNTEGDEYTYRNYYANDGGRRSLVGARDSFRSSFR
jgi:hypothetical protein